MAYILGTHVIKIHDPLLLLSMQQLHVLPQGNTRH